MRYNKLDTPFHKAAKRIKDTSRPLLEDLRAISDQVHPTVRSNGDVGTSSDIDVGDLEAATGLLEALVAPETGEERDNLAGLFAYELAKPKEPTPPPPTPPPPKKRETAEERRLRIAEREARAKERTVSRPTRASKALEQAFAQEAGVPLTSSDAEIPSNRRARRGVKEEPSTTPAESSSSAARHASKNQRGVVGLESFVALSDRDRRERERQLDLFTEDIGNHDQFTRFNVGWVLPEGSKRKRAERPDPPKIVRK